MNDSNQGNAGDTDGDFDFSGFLDDGDSDAGSAKSKAAPKPKAVNPSAAKPAREDKDARAIKGRLPDSKPGDRKGGGRSSGYGDQSYTDRRDGGEGRPIRPSGPASRASGPRPTGPRSEGPAPRGGAPRGGSYDKPAGQWDKGPRRDAGGYSDQGQSPSRYPSRKPGFNRDAAPRGPASIHHIPPRVIERVGGDHKPASAEIKPFLPLKTDKGRWKESRFLLEGAKNIADVLSVSPGILSTVFVTEEFEDKELLTLIKKNRIETIKVSQDDIRALADTESPQGILAVANFATLKPDWNLARYVTLLDGVQDPGNVGGIFRTSLALGMDAVVVGKGSCDPYNPKVVRSSVGALMRLPFETGEDLGAKMEFLRLKGFSIVATSSHAKLTLDQAKLRKKVALIVGNEGAGTGAQYQDMADAVVRIPLKNKVESLNVSVAHGILTYQLLNSRT
jgi:TrmH family RNA methyltransferase